jgi:hypothetical protein
VNFFIAVQLLSMIHLFPVSEGLIACLVPVVYVFLGCGMRACDNWQALCHVKPGLEATKMVAKNWFMPVILRDGIETCGENVLVTAAFWLSLAVRQQLLSGMSEIRSHRYRVNWESDAAFPLRLIRLV